MDRMVEMGMTLRHLKYYERWYIEVSYILMVLNKYVITNCQAS